LYLWYWAASMELCLFLLYYSIKSRSMISNDVIICCWLYSMFCMYMLNVMGSFVLFSSLGLLQWIGTDDKARREMKALVSRMLRENITQNKDMVDVSKESLYRSCHDCLDSLLHLFMQVLVSSFSPFSVLYLVGAFSCLYGKWLSNNLQWHTLPVTEIVTSWIIWISGCVVKNPGFVCFFCLAGQR
jgi:hypothetical protein